MSWLNIQAAVLGWWVEAFAAGLIVSALWDRWRKQRAARRLAAMMQHPAARFEQHAGEALAVANDDDFGLWLAELREGGSQ